MMLCEKIELNSLKVLFSQVNDPRKGANCRHSIQEILFLAIVAVLCGAETWQAIDIFGQSKITWLRKYFSYRSGSPSRHTVARLFSLIRPVYFEAMIAETVRFLQRTEQGNLIAIDGKSVRGSGSFRDTPLHLLNAFSIENGLSLSQVECPKNGNEISAIPHILDTLQMEGSTITIDAIGTQTSIAKQIRTRGADYILAVKQNQLGLYREIESYFEQTGFTFDRPEYFFETLEKHHGRIERRCYQVAHIPRSRIFSRWHGCHSIIMVMSEITRNNITSSQVRYFLSSLDPNPQQAAKCIRGHWNIENQLHWTLDVVFNEDGDLKRKDHAPRNFSALRKIVLNIVRKFLGSTTGVKNARIQAAYDHNFLEKIVTTSFS